MGKKEKAPCLRFKDTNGKDYPAWEQRELSSLSELITKGTSPLGNGNDGDINFIKVENLDSFSGKILSCSKVSKEEHLTYLRRSILYKGDILFSIAGTLGRTAIVPEDILPANTNQALAIIRTKNQDPRFLFTALKSRTVTDFIKKNPTVGAQPNLSLAQVGSLKIPYPSRAEQEKIGEFFSQLDTTITLHQRKLETLKKLKRTLLQKMFPKKGQLKPELRFPGFTNDWEQRKLNEIASIYDGTHQTPRYTSNGIPFLSVENITTLQSSKFISEKDFLRDFPVYPKKGDVLLTRIGDVGTANVYERNQKVAFYVSLALLKLRETDPYFVNASFRSNSTRKEVWKRTLHIAFPKKINKNEIGKVNIQIPSLAEQRKIGIFFYSLDRLITLHQRKLETYKKLKKSLLQKMFI